MLLPLLFWYSPLHENLPYSHTGDHDSCMGASRHNLNRHILRWRCRSFVIIQIFLEPCDGHRHPFNFHGIHRTICGLDDFDYISTSPDPSRPTTRHHDNFCILTPRTNRPGGIFYSTSWTILQDSPTPTLRILQVSHCRDYRCIHQRCLRDHLCRAMGTSVGMVIFCPSRCAKHPAPDMYSI